MATVVIPPPCLTLYIGWFGGDQEKLVNNGILELGMVFCYCVYIRVCVCVYIRVCMCVYVSLALIKRFMKDCFWGRLDYLVIGSYASNHLHSFHEFLSRVRCSRENMVLRHTSRDI